MNNFFDERSEDEPRFPGALPLHPAPPRIIIGVYHKGKKKDEKMLDAIKRLFRRKHTTPRPAREGQGVGLPLRIEGVKPAPLTPQPDDAELATTALLESMAEVSSSKFQVSSKHARKRPEAKGATAEPETLNLKPETSGATAAYYRALAERIRTARIAEARLVMRLLSSVEEQLSEPTALYKGQWGDTERKLYRAMDVAEREGGELHRRWQHCLANVLVRRMEEEREATEDGRRKMEDGSSDGQTETPSQNPTEGRTTNPTEGRLAMPTEGRPADTTLETSSQTVLPVTEAAINQP